jgi:hypothetical protein
LKLRSVASEIQKRLELGCWLTPQARTILALLTNIRFILWTKMKELEKGNTTTMVKVVASLPILTKEGS